MAAAAAEGVVQGQEDLPATTMTAAAGADPVDPRGAIDKASVLGRVTFSCRLLAASRAALHLQLQPAAAISLCSRLTRFRLCSAFQGWPPSSRRAGRQYWRSRMRASWCRSGMTQNPWLSSSTRSMSARRCGMAVTSPCGIRTSNATAATYVPAVALGRSQQQHATSGCWQPCGL